MTEWHGPTDNSYYSNRNDEFDYETMPWGKYEGYALTNIPTNYLQWLTKNCDWNDELVNAVHQILDERFKGRGLIS